MMEGYAENEGAPLVCIGYKYNVTKGVSVYNNKRCKLNEPGLTLPCQVPRQI